MPADLRKLLAASVVACVVACTRTADQPVETGAITAIDAPAGPNSGEPNLAVDGAGRVHLSWLERNADSSVSLRLAVRDNGQWSTPVTVTTGRDLFVNWADFPSVFVAPSGRIVMHWLQRQPGGKYSYGVRVSQSTDGGASWSDPKQLHDDQGAGEHGFVSFFAADGDSVEAIWLDGRGPVVVYRDRSAEEIRDIAIVRRVNGKWTEPTRVHADDWHIEGCPVNGPSVVADGDNVAVAWFTGARDTAKVNIAFSKDAGATFSAPVRVDDGQPAGRVDVEFDGDGRAMVTWLERVGQEGAEVRLRAIAPDGVRGDVMVVANSAAARSSGFPRVVRSGDELIFAWTQPGDTARVRMASTRLTPGQR